MNFSVDHLIKVFREAVDLYHVKDDVDQVFENPYANQPEEVYFHKCWVDTVQWHLEDIIRDVNIDPVKALEIKRRIDKSNQVRTDMVEQIDEQIRNFYADVEVLDNAKLNTESPAWAIDRLSILMLKIYHMDEQANRPEIDDELRASCNGKLAVLLEQEKDLSTSIAQLLEAIKEGKVYMKVYKQMKMYNDPKLNPVLYKAKS
ncbi:MAG: DUF4254 domain-containing protein [Schleiferiaceae bacterium]|jgi:hypothetical protein|nr:DUF4254 domain-containing protein [Schleiferiaceae bacterium]